MLHSGGVRRLLTSFRVRRIVLDSFKQLFLRQLIEIILVVLLMVDKDLYVAPQILQKL